MTSLGKTIGAALLALVTTTTVLSTTAPVAHARDDQRAPHRSTAEPIVIGHRGASGYRPEHTLEAYRLAIAQGADYIEPDLVPTRDGVLVARHENLINDTTDVADRPEFADRRTTKVIDGRPHTGWFTEDFTLAELKTLRAKERLPQVRPQNTQYDGRYEVPTLSEVLALAKREGNRQGRRIGVYAETKHPSYFASIGLPMERTLVRTLRRHGMDQKNAKVYLQSFETGNLRELDRMTRVPLVQLMDSRGAPYDLIAKGDPRTYRDLATPAGLREIATYADGIGPHKDMVLPRDAQNRIGAPSSLVRDAHREGLFVHVFTLRRENQFLPANYRRGTDPNGVGDLAGETLAFLDAGVDGAFTDNPDIVVAARRSWAGEERRAG